MVVLFFVVWVVVGGGGGGGGFYFEGIHWLVRICHMSYVICHMGGGFLGGCI